MKSSHLLLATLCLVFTSFTPLKAQIHTIKGEGSVVSQDRKTGAFKEIHSFGSFDISISAGENHSIRVEAQENLQPYIEVNVEGNDLNIRQKKGVNFKTDKSIKIYVTAPSLQAVRLRGSGNITGENRLKGSEKFEINSAGSGNISLDVESFSIIAEISGSGNIVLKGKTKELEGKIHGSGNIKARELQSEITSVKISGSGNAEVVATQKLSTKIAGSGEIKYWGDAAVDNKVVGSGRVSKEK